MILKELRELLNKKPDTLTQEEFDNLPVLVQTGEESFDIPFEDESGYVVFTNKDESVNEAIEHSIDPEDEDVPAFLIAITPLPINTLNK